MLALQNVPKNFELHRAGCTKGSRPAIFHSRHRGIKLRARRDYYGISIWQESTSLNVSGDDTWYNLSSKKTSIWPARIR
jgi:hypothetical protein